MIGHATEILRSWLTTSRKEQIHGVLVTYRGLSDSRWETWQEILEEWLPVFKEAGWLDNLNAIHIEKDRLRSGNAGQYQWLFQNVILHPNPGMSEGYSVSTNKEEVLIHEMAHHAHRNEMGILIPRRAISTFPSYENDFKRYVSEYAGTSMFEAVAEMATGAAMGENYPSRLHRAYDEFDGPDVSVLRSAQSEDL